MISRWLLEPIGGAVFIQFYLITGSLFEGEHLMRFCVPLALFEMIFVIIFCAVESLLQPLVHSASIFIVDFRFLL